MEDTGSFSLHTIFPFPAKQHRYFLCISAGGGLSFSSIKFVNHDSGKEVHRTEYSVQPTMHAGTQGSYELN